MKIKLSEYKGVVFDLDDTLIDRKKAYSEIFTLLYNEHEVFNSKLTLEESLSFFWTLSPNNSIDIKYAFSEIKLKFPTFKLDFENFYRFYYDNMINLVKPYDGVKDFLLQLVKQNINFGVVTNGNEYQFKKIINTGLEGLFNFVIASEIYGYNKPDIEIYQETLRQLKLTSKDVENVIFIGDNPYTDIIGAKKIGFKTAWIKMDFEYPKDLSPPDYIIESFNVIEI